MATAQFGIRSQRVSFFPSVGERGFNSIDPKPSPFRIF